MITDLIGRIRAIFTITSLHGARVALLCVFAALFWTGGTLSTVATLLEDYDKAPLVIAISCFLPSLMLLAPAVWAWTGRLALASKLFLAALYVNLAFVTINVGGIFATSAIYLLVLPLLASFLLDRRWAAGTGFGVIATLIALYLFRDEMGAPIHRMDPDAFAYSLVFVLVFTALGIGIASAVFQQTMEVLTIKQAKASQEAIAAHDAKARFLANMSHEIRSPLNGLTATLSLILEKNPPQGIRDHAQIALESSQALTGILNDLLDLSRLEAGPETVLEARPFEPARLIGDVALLHEPWAHEKGLTLTVRTDLPHTLCLVGDPVRLRQILMNLVSNAIKYTATGGMTIRVVSTPTDGQMRILTIDVEDTGPGISHDDQQRLFRRFERLGAEADGPSGAGLGLAIAKQLAELMGGTLTLDSIPGMGSRFRVTLPLPEVERFTPAASKSQAPWPARLSGLKVLVVEDDRINQVVIASILDTLGCDMALATDGLEALGIVQAGSFDLILMDIDLPGLSGLQTAERMRALGPAFARIPMLAVTGRTMRDHRDYYARRGFCGCLTKPFEAGQLVTALRTALAQNPAQAQSPNVIANAPKQSAHG